SALAVSAGEIGWYYGRHFEPGEWQHLDSLVLQPRHVSRLDLHRLKRLGVRPLAYVSVGEVAREAGYFSRLPKGALLDDNTAWRSVRLDVRRPEVRRFIVEQLVERALEKGFEGVFLDTVDSFHALPKGEQATFRQGMIELIRAIRQKVGRGPVWLNRGFDLLDAVHDQISGVAFESLYQGYDARREAYVAVPEADRKWLLEQIRRVKAMGLPVVSIDYLPPERAGQEAQALARKIEAAGAQPWITDAHLTRVGVSHVTPLPRKVLGLFESPKGFEAFADASDLHRFLATPLEYLGYFYDYRRADRPVELEDPVGRYAGVAIWAQGQGAGHYDALCERLGRWNSWGLPVVFIGMIPDVPSCRALAGVGNLQPLPGRLRIGRVVHGVGRFEGRLRLRRLDVQLFQPAQDAHLEPWLTLTDGHVHWPQIAVTDRGGFALSPYLFEAAGSQEEDSNLFWLFDPVAFLRAALKLPELPAVDVTTENGRRILMAHIDGDGFVSRAEFGDHALSGQVILEKVLRRFRTLPHTVSVIEAEVAPWGVYPKSSAEAERIARRIFRLKNVEPASHTYSHPFVWRHIEGIAIPKNDEYGWNLPVKHYTPSVRREIDGSVDYINRRLAPKDKPVRVLLWSGDCLPGPKALARVEWRDLLNMNGGDTKLTRYANSLSRVWPVGRPTRVGVQIYAPETNENNYTNLWHGPYYGYRNVITTFRLLDGARRLKPIDIYYHFYSGSKAASLNALLEVYDWALSQPITPMFAGEYAARGQAFYTARWVRLPDGRLRLYSHWPVRTLRVSAGRPLLTGERVLGWKRHGKDRYVHLAPERVMTFSQEEAPPSGPWLEESSAVIDRVNGYAGERRWTIRFHAGLVPMFRWKNAAGCRVRSSEQGMKVQRSGAVLTVRLPARTPDVERTLTLACGH
ncbi:endo alpha-1,4 polygalactosaminidase, partial [Sulfurivirga sp.]|uniref:endo alpha-1,4 polygalactosaminidase n=1 Tax=Sulfurivirga sp. TaxID=2614236 RepID=UPI0025E948AB